MRRYLLTSDAEYDLDEIKAYLLRQGGKNLAQYVLREIREALRFLGRTPEAGHRREDLTDAPVKFWDGHLDVASREVHARGRKIRTAVNLT